MANSSFKWDRGDLGHNLDGAEKRAADFLARTTQYHALRAEAYMKSHAPWTDRTGNARSGLATFAATDQAADLHFEIILYGSVNYQWWLETRWPSNGTGRYAIIIPTIREESPAYFETARKLMETMFGGGPG